MKGQSEVGSEVEGNRSVSSKKVGSILYDLKSQYQSNIINTQIDTNYKLSLNLITIIKAI